MTPPLAFLGALALCVASGCLAWADTGWFGERVPEGLTIGAAHGDYVHRGDGGAMVYVPAGYFLRGTTKAEAEALGRQFGDFFGVGNAAALHLPVGLLHRQIRGHQPAIRRLPGRARTRRPPPPASRRAARQGLHPDVLARPPPQRPRSSGHRGRLVRRRRLLSLGRQDPAHRGAVGKGRRAARTGWRTRGAIPGRHRIPTTSNRRSGTRFWATGNGCCCWAIWTSTP